jgi:hypothetical protein
MGQLNVYLQEAVERRIREVAAAQGKSLSGLVAEILMDKFAPHSEWPAGFFQSLRWHGGEDIPARADTSILDLPDVKLD